MYTMRSFIYISFELLLTPLLGKSHTYTGSFVTLAGHSMCSGSAIVSRVRGYHCLWMGIVALFDFVAAATCTYSIRCWVVFFLALQFFEFWIRNTFIQQFSFHILKSLESIISKFATWKIEDKDFQSLVHLLCSKTAYNVLCTFNPNFSSGQNEMSYLVIASILQLVNMVHCNHKCIAKDSTDWIFPLCSTQ